MARNDSSSQRGFDEPLRLQWGNKRVTIEEISDLEPSSRSRTNDSTLKEEVAETGGKRTPKADGRKNNGRKKGSTNRRGRKPAVKAEEK